MARLSTPVADEQLLRPLIQLLWIHPFEFVAILRLMVREAAA